MFPHNPTKAIKKRNLTRYLLPYCIKPVGEERYIFLNRDYKPIGFNVSYSPWVNYEDYPISFLLRESSLKKIPLKSGDNYYLYNDNTHPRSSKKNLMAYFEVLSTLFF